MKIECILKRQGGTFAEIDGIEYHFEPVADGAHVADVTLEAHIDRFLAIADGYKLYHGKEEPAGQPKQAAQGLPRLEPAATPIGALPLAGSEQHPPQFEIAGKVFTQREIVEKAFAASGLSSDEWNELGEDERAAKMDIVLDELADASETETTDDRAALVEAYKAKFGKAPHHKKSLETIKAELEA